MSSGDGMITELRITINGAVLTVGQTKALHSAVENFASYLYPPDCLGTDERGVTMRKTYLERIAEIRKLMGY